VFSALACSNDKEPTPPPSGPAPHELSIAGAPVLIGAGDIAVCDKNGDEGTARIVDSVIVADSVAGLKTVVATFGDNAYPSGHGGVKDDFPRCFSPSWGNKRIMSLIRPAPGNHDYDSGSGDPYFAYFGDRAGPAGRGYFSYDVGAWHIISLNSEVYFEHFERADADAQEDWLQKDLANHKTLCTMAYYHRPYFSSGVYGTNKTMRKLWQILYDGKVDLVLNGHEHDYERFLPQNATGQPDPTGGTEEIVVGTGGGNLREIRETPAPNSAYRIHGRFGVIKLSLGDSGWTHAFIDIQGRVWDPEQHNCH
jgi:hypothetical protein